MLACYESIYNICTNKNTLKQSIEWIYVRFCFRIYEIQFANVAYNVGIDQDDDTEKNWNDNSIDIEKATGFEE